MDEERTFKDHHKMVLEQLRFLKYFEEETEGLTEFQKKLMLKGAVSCIQKELADEELEHQLFHKERMEELEF